MWNFAGMCVNADQGRLRISLGAIGDQTLAGFLPVLPLDTPVRSRGSCGTLTAMKPQQSSVSAAGKDLDKSRIPAMCNACLLYTSQATDSQAPLMNGGPNS